MDQAEAVLAVNQAIGMAGAAICFSLCAMGSILGLSAVVPAAIGAWKKCYMQNKQAPFLLMAFVGVPLSQTLYGMIVMFSMFEKATVGFPLLLLGVFTGVAIGLSAFLQGKGAAGAADAQAETGQGIAYYLIALGAIEAIAIFVMVFVVNAIGRIGI